MNLIRIFDDCYTKVYNMIYLWMYTLSNDKVIQKLNNRNTADIKVSYYPTRNGRIVNTLLYRTDIK